MTQVGKRRREGVVEPPDLEGLYPSEKSVKRRRMGVVQPPVYEQLQVQVHDISAAAANANLNTRSVKNDEESPTVEREKSPNGVREEEKEPVETEE